MKISNISAQKTNYKPYFTSKKRYLPENKYNNKKTSVDFKFYFLKHNIGNFEKFLNKDGAVSLEEFKALDKNIQKNYFELAKRYVDNADIEDLDVKINDIANYSHILMKHFDSLCGKDNYTVISLGTSPALITRGMEYLGNNVIYLPVSGISKAKREFDGFYDIDKEKIAVIMEYLKSKKLKENVIVMDYCFSGATLSYMTSQIINEYPNNADNIKKYNIVGILEEIMGESPKINKLEWSMRAQAMGKISGVAHYDVIKATSFSYLIINPKAQESKEVMAKNYKKIAEEYSTPLSRAYFICLLNEIEKL